MPSALSKSKWGTLASKHSCNVVDLVHIKSEGDKHNIRNFSLVVDIDEKFVTIQKCVGNQLRSKKYLVKCDEIFPAVETKFRTQNELSPDEDTKLEEESEPKIQLLRRSRRNRKLSSWLNGNEYHLS